MGWDRTWVAGLAKWESVVGVVYGRNALDGKGNCGTFKEDEVDEKEENRDYEQEMEVSLQSLRRRVEKGRRGLRSKRGKGEMLDIGRGEKERTPGGALEMADISISSTLRNHEVQLRYNLHIARFVGIEGIKQEQVRKTKELLRFK
ncbi:hypothetical protein PV325_004734 [Microctonus aethiopoides]|nr:hypothetical protein PV325_004734 [Microctonus aethiopoides]